MNARRQARNDLLNNNCKRISDLLKYKKTTQFWNAVRRISKGEKQTSEEIGLEQLKSFYKEKFSKPLDSRTISDCKLRVDHHYGSIKDNVYHETITPGMVMKCDSLENRVCTR